MTGSPDHGDRPCDLYDLYDELEYGPRRERVDDELRTPQQRIWRHAAVHLERRIAENAALRAREEDR